MAGGITVTPEQLQSISAQLASGEQEIESILSQLRSVVSPLQTDWVGAAGSQFEELFASGSRMQQGCRTHSWASRDSTGESGVLRD